MDFEDFSDCYDDLPGLLISLDSLPDDYYDTLLSDDDFYFLGGSDLGN